MKRLLLTSASIVTLLFGAAALAWQDPSHSVGIQEGVAGSRVGFSESIDNTAGEDTRLNTEESIGVPVTRTGASYDERLEIIRGRIRSYEAEKNNGSLLEGGSERQNVVIPLVLNDAVEHYINYFTIVKREMFKRWLDRTRRYSPMVKEVLRGHGLPEDLVYLAMIESGFNLLAHSPMKAAGPWQFIPETGRRYGLEINHWVDERRDIQKSTVAAARYLEDLFDQFGCWYLAAAGYNAGENRIDRLIKRHGTHDFWELRAYNALPRETQEYVPQLIAAAIVAKDPERYGLDGIEEPSAFTFVEETVPGGVPLKMVARAASVGLATIKKLNPEMKTGITPPRKEYCMRLPVQTNRNSFRSSLSSIMKERKRVVGVIRHVARQQDNLPRITKRYGVNRQDLELVNASPFALKTGTVIYVPLLDESDEDREPISLKMIERTKHQDLRRVRGTGTTARNVSFAAGRTETDKKNEQTKGSKKGRIELGKSSVIKHVDKHPPKEAQKRYHVVKGDENLAIIASKYKKTTESLRRLNKLKSDRVCRGTKLRVL